jgi:hypothetical protein
MKFVSKQTDELKEKREVRASKRAERESKKKEYLASKAARKAAQYRGFPEQVLGRVSSVFRRKAKKVKVEDKKRRRCRVRSGHVFTGRLFVIGSRAGTLDPKDAEPR